MSFMLLSISKVSIWLGPLASRCKVGLGIQRFVSQFSEDKNGRKQGLTFIEYKYSITLHDDLSRKIEAISANNTQIQTHSIFT